jgi:hypothetical protein
MDTYEHKQFSPWPLLALGFFAFSRMKKRRSSVPALGLALFALQFCVLTTRVDEHSVSWNFGVGFPSGQIRLDDIADAHRTKTGLLEGFGIHWTLPHGWLWNAGGRDAVLIRKKSGGIITLGSDDAAALYEAIRTRISS